MSRVFGFVVVEERTRLLDWGVRQTRSDKEATTIRKLKALVDMYQPYAIVVEDCEHPLSRRRLRVRTLLAAIARFGRTVEVPVHRLAPPAAHAAFAGEGAVTKYAIATVVAARFPALAKRLPPKREVWMTEDDRFAIFDAAALAIAFFEQRGGARRKSQF